MKRTRHLKAISELPEFAQSPVTIKLTGITALVDRLLLVERQSQWKIVGSGEDTGGTEGEGEGEGGIDLPI